MPMALRPGTTETRQAATLIERAMSSDRADDARGLDARRRLQLVEGDHRPGPDLIDLAADAEFGQHALEQAPPSPPLPPSPNSPAFPPLPPARPSAVVCE